MTQLTFSIEDAIQFATEAHSGQFRKYTHEPYIEHPIEVMKIVETALDCTHAMKIAAVLHDTVEDTDVTFDDIRKRFGGTVEQYVFALTDPDVEGNRAFRKKAAAEHLAKYGTAECHTIKYADLISNTISIKIHDPKFYKVYKEEKKYLLSLIPHGCPKLKRHALAIIQD